jgi:hypothetical protein
MPTGACGIDCNVCQLNLLGVCSTCGSGRSSNGRRKAAAQRRLFGTPCPILECAIDHGVDYCTRDCDVFPCSQFKIGPYPFSHGFLNMQERRRKEHPPLISPSGDEVEMPVQHWEDLNGRDLESICQSAIVKLDANHGILLPFIKEYLRVDLKQRCLYRQVHGDWKRIHNTLLELVCLVYLLRAGPESLDHEMIGINELKTAHFFKGPHALKTRPLIDRYGRNLEGLKKAAEEIGGVSLDMADAAYMFQAFPKVPLYYLFWEGDEEFQPQLRVLFDRSIERHLTTDTIWGLVTLVSDLLCVGGKWYMQ